jgi:hypothetical protein
MGLRKDWGNGKLMHTIMKIEGNNCIITIRSIFQFFLIYQNKGPRKRRMSIILEKSQANTGLKGMGKIDHLSVRSSYFSIV